MAERAIACIVGIAGMAVAALGPSDARADSGLPPWTDADDLPLPAWARSLAPRKPEVSLFQAPSAASPRRGSVVSSTHLPLFGAKRGAGCAGRWLLVGPLAWVCSDAVDLRAEEPFFTPSPALDDGLPYRYFFVGRGGASAFVNLESAEDGASDQDLDPGFGVAVVEERGAFGEAWGRTRHGQWIAMRELVPARPSPFRGTVVDGTLDFAWVVADKASVFAGASPGSKRTGTRVRFDRIEVREERPSTTPGGGVMVRISADGADVAQWMLARDLAHPTVAAPPAEVAVNAPAASGTAAGASPERWIDVDLASQTLVAYEGAKPVFATLVSTGKGADGSETATPRGVHRIWVKLVSSTMDNLEREDAERHYSIEDVPYVQFFDKAVALHGAFWHRDFGRMRSHGCVNLAPRDAEWLFQFTGPHMPSGWVAALPTLHEPGTAIRVR